MGECEKIILKGHNGNVIDYFKQLSICRTFRTSSFRHYKFNFKILNLQKFTNKIKLWENAGLTTKTACLLLTIDSHVNEKRITQERRVHFELHEAIRIATEFVVVVVIDRGEADEEAESGETGG